MSHRPPEPSGLTPDRSPRLGCHDTEPTSSIGTTDHILHDTDYSAEVPVRLPATCTISTKSRKSLDLIDFGDNSTTPDVAYEDAPSTLLDTPCIFIEGDPPPLQQRRSESPPLSEDVRDWPQRRCSTLPVYSDWKPSQRNFDLIVGQSNRSEPVIAAETEGSSLNNSKYQVASNSCRIVSSADKHTRQNLTGITRSDSALDEFRSLRRSVRNDMASAFPQMSGDARRHFSSSGGGGANRYENNRPPVNRSTPCKNGPLCRKFQEGTCPFNHDFSSMPANGLSAPKKSLNVESPSFTPKTAHAQPAGVQSPRSMGISPKSAAAAAFTPRGSGSVTPSGASHSKAPSNEFVPQNFQPSANFQEFVPQNFVQSQQLDQQTQLSNQINAFADPFLASHALQSLDGSHQTINPYADHTPAAAGQAFFQDATAFKHPLNYHLYAPLGPRREMVTPYQRTTSDFFLPDDLREDLQRKSEATLQTFPNSALPQNVDNHFHSLVALDNVSQRSTSVFGYPTWIYKATSSIDGNVYALRRIEGFRLTSDSAINTKQAWKKLASANVVRAHDAFTTSAFGDRSLVLVQDYHPLSQTLAAKHFGRPSQPTPLPEETLWSYTVQLANALKAIHSAGLAARTLVPSKVLVTDTNRLRLSGCAVLDIVQFETTSSQPLADQHSTDLRDLGRLLLGLATRNPNAHANVPKALELVSRSYTERFRGCLQWLLSPPAEEDPDNAASAGGAQDYNIHTLVTNLSDQILSTFDASLSRSDALTSNLASELENGRLVRLLTKLLTILERPPSEASNSSNFSQPSAAWSETGERYHLRLFRDYVFHRVDADGRAVLDLGHVLACLNKLDAGSDERVQLVSPDGQSVFVVTYREVKRGVESAWGELSRGGRR